ncbi:hypothetical protein Tco_1539588 [Tanacetum coccineum]
MESLHISFKRVVDAGMFNGIVLNSVMHLSHMLYADDAVFMGQWSTKNIDTIIYVLKCFHRASGLCINLSKSKVIGCGGEEEGWCKLQIELVVVSLLCVNGFGGLQLKRIVRLGLFKAIHGEDGKNGSGFKVGYKSIWLSILHEVETLKIKDGIGRLIGSGEFSVASARKVIDDNRFPEVSTQTRWIKAGVQLRLTFMRGR